MKARWSATIQPTVHEEGGKEEGDEEEEMKTRQLLDIEKNTVKQLREKLAV